MERSSGILLHITSLPGRFGIGTLGHEAYGFLDFLIESGQKLWQILPLGHTGYGDSPYQCFSAFAGNPLLIDLEKLVEQELLKESDLPVEKSFDTDYVDYGKVVQYKYPLLHKAFENFRLQENKVRRMQFETFCLKNNDWLEDYVFFMSLKDHFKGKPWWQWDEAIKLREPEALARYRQHLQVAMEFYRFIQFLFYRQWKALKAYANMNDIKIIGDLPLYVSFDSTEAWANPETFDFDEKRNPHTVAGVPPDYFSETGQLWGNPIYNWDYLQATDFQWWVHRVKANFNLFDMVR
ncbi:MAG: 4-alpha-glucanotransferase, partial [Bacteroidales bacterium]